MDDLRGVPADAGERLGQQRHLAERQPSDDESGFSIAYRGHVTPRRRPVEALLIGDQRGRKGFFAKFFEEFQREKLRLFPRSEAMDLPLGVGAENGGFPLDRGDELCRILRQRTGIVPLLFQAAEQTEQ